MIILVVIGLVVLVIMIALVVKYSQQADKGLSKTHCNVINNDPNEKQFRCQPECNGGLYTERALIGTCPDGQICCEYKQSTG